MSEERPRFIEWIRKQFKTTIPDDYELEFDICMKCGRRLPDRRYLTLKEHQEKNHKITRKKKAKEMMFKYPVMTVFIFVGVALIGLTVLSPVLELVVDPVLKKIYPDMIDIQKCNEDVLAFKKDLYNSGSFTSNHVEEFNRLLNECNLNFFAIIKDRSIFEQDEYKTET